MRYSLMITDAPTAPGARHALDMARALLAAGHELDCLFFYRDGVKMAAPGAGGAAPAWRDWLAETGLEGVVCVGAAARRGLADDAGAGDLEAGFRLVGLGHWIQAAADSDRQLSFGS
jgi:tRNA 2-thiouridine synthesizing protein D